MAVARQGKLARLVCSYAEGISFVHRTKAECKVMENGDCTADPSACKARCD